MSEETKNPNYWKSLNELANNDEYRKFVEREFPEDATELTDKVSRRSFLRVMGASIALAGFAACRRPVQKILPYSRQPEDVIPGVPLYYASAVPFQDTLTGIVVENHEGRPTKIEGNEQHPSSLGSSSIFDQAEILNMYDPDRSRYIRKDGQRSSKNDFISFCNDHFSDTQRSILFISEANSSPTYNRVKQQALSKFSNAQWVTWEPFSEDNALQGTEMVFGESLRTIPHFDRADVIVSFDDDFLNPARNKNSVANSRKFAESRNVRSTEDDLSRLYAVESTYSLTGSNADNRLRLKTGQIEPFIFALAGQLSREISGLNAFSGYANEYSSHQWINVLVEELINNRGSSLLTAGQEHKPAVHAAVAAINHALGNTRTTVTYHRVPHIDQSDNLQQLSAAVERMNNGNIDTVVMIGTNPVFTAPADLNVAGALGRVQQVIHLSKYYNETSRRANWHINRAHVLEAWGDGYSYDGMRSVIQPQIRPLFSGISEIEFLDMVVNGRDTDGYELVQNTWRRYYTNNFRQRWKQILHDGIDTGGHFPAVSVSLDSGFSNAIRESIRNMPSGEGIELVIRPDNTVYDGRFANNGWLQELPDPMTKITWDNVALMSPATAEKLDISNEEVIEISTGDGTSVRLPAWIQPGHADDSITVHVGYGHEGWGKVANGTGVDTYPLRTTSRMLYEQDVTVNKTGEFYKIASTQDHHSLEGRDHYREASIDEYRDNPDFATFESVHGYAVPGIEESTHEEYGAKSETGEDQPISLFDEQTFPDHEPQWGMAIDLNTCIGCGACTIACQAENNIPVIGKREVHKGREMHWIRTDRYFEGDENDPKVAHQPVPCMHCELAPCEQVCPVAATTHSEDGMNQMTYNRCIGTRYCANNCPYKVRRFNFFNYAKEYLTTGDDPEIVQMAMNPEVTVRFRGVMEKCTYCVQRVNRAKITAKQETGSPKPEDGAVQTACQQACPTKAIYFGDLTDNDSEVVQVKNNERDYLMLEELNTRPRTSYLAKIRNPNPKLA